MKIKIETNYNRKPLDISKIIPNETQNALKEIIEPHYNLTDEALKKALNIKTTQEKLEDLRKSLNIPATIGEQLKENIDKTKRVLEIINPQYKLKKEFEKINNNSISKLIEDFKGKNYQIIQDTISKVNTIDFYKNNFSFKDDYSNYYKSLLQKINSQLSFIQELNKNIPKINTDENYPLKEKALFLNNTALMIEAKLKGRYKKKLTKEMLEAIIFNLKNFYIDSTIKSNINTSSMAYFLKALREANLNSIEKYNNNFVYNFLFLIIEELLDFVEKVEEIIKFCEKTKKCFMNSFNFAVEKIYNKKYELIREVYINNFTTSKYKKIAGILNYLSKQNNISSSKVFKIFVYLISFKDKKYNQRNLKQYSDVNIEFILNKRDIILTA